MGQIIALVSGSGGSGKSALCAQLAGALVRQGKRVVCIDCDVQKGCLDLYLGLSREMALSFVDLCRGDYPLERACAHPVLPHLRYISAPVQFHPGDLDGDAFAQLLRRAADACDYVLLDGGTLGAPGFALAAEFADRCILVTGWDAPALRTAYRAGQALELMGKRNVRLIVNRIQPKTMAELGVTVDDVMDAAGLPLLGIVPEDRTVLLSAAEKAFFPGNKQAAAACSRIAMRIQGLTVPVSIR